MEFRAAAGADPGAHLSAYAPTSIGPLGREYTSPDSHGGPPKRPRRAQTTADERKPTAGHGAKPAAVREKAILALLSEPTIGKAAATCGVGESNTPGVA